jgi:hypothetical protein
MNSIVNYANASVKYYDGKCRKICISCVACSSSMKVMLCDPDYNALPREYPVAE